MNLKELADSLGLSPTTVSRALNGYPEVGQTTRARVMAAAEAADYTPSARARHLATGQSMAIGHVIPLIGRSEIVNPIFADFLAGAGEAYAAQGYEILLSVVGDGQSAAAYRQMVRRGSVDGVMVQGPETEDPRIDVLKSLGMPFIVHGRTRTPEGYSWLDIENTRAYRKATEFLLDLGHRRIALINGQDRFDFARRRRDGYEAALTDRGVPVEGRLIFSDVMTEGYGFDTAARLLDGPEPPTAMLVSSMISAVGVRRAAEARGLMLGRDLSVICHDDELSYLSNHGPGLTFTATRSSIRDAGRRAAEMLITLIRDPGAAPLTELWEVDLVLGDTTAPPR
ncbi:MAG: substrate-binding domain-containing protein [Rhodobacteraceae bacterium]|nr:substrate-binding domain-containing protein [Paracoccaceae bacterium]